MSDRRRILVAGGAGFLGSHLVDRLLADGHDVLCVDNFFTGRKDNILHLLQNPWFELCRHDITMPLYVEVDAIYNLACPASPLHYQHDPVQTLKTCVHGSINLLGLAKRLNVPILLASTSEVYGDPHVHPQTEDYWGHVNPIGRRSCYDEGKRCAETLFFDYGRQYELPIKVARIFNTYGPRMHPQDGRVVSNFIVQALRGEDLTIYGDGRQTRSFCYVDELVDGLIRLMEFAPRHHRPDQPRQSAGVHDRRARAAGHRAQRLALAPRAAPAAERRPAPAPPRHHARPPPARLAAGDRAAGRAAAHDRLLREPSDQGQAAAGGRTADQRRRLTPGLPFAGRPRPIGGSLLPAGGPRSCCADRCVAECTRSASRAGDRDPALHDRPVPESERRRGDVLTPQRPGAAIPRSAEAGRRIEGGSCLRPRCPAKKIRDHAMSSMIAAIAIMPRSSVSVTVLSGTESTLPMQGQSMSRPRRSAMMTPIAPKVTGRPSRRR